MTVSEKKQIDTKLNGKLSTHLPQKLNFSCLLLFQQGINN